MVDGQSSMVNGRWSMVDGRWLMADRSPTTINHVFPESGRHPDRSTWNLKPGTCNLEPETCNLEP
ncbi:MAG: restriction endonuclease [Armatimonadetes bacterium]|nr:restriction endonuclease [Armatimonadota bacterium]